MRLTTLQPAAVDLKQVVVVIPALNEQQSISLVLNDLPPVAAVFVVDNGSKDRTAEVARGLGAFVVSEPQRGYGSACLAGIAAVRNWVRQDDHCANPVIVFADADYSDHVDMLTKLVQPILDKTHDFVLGSRLAGCREPGSMPPQSVYGNRLACGLMNFFWKGNYSDLGPFRAIRLDQLERLKMVDTNYGWTIEMQIKALRMGLRILEVPVPYRRRTGTSKISGTVRGTIKAGAKILYSLWRYRR